MLGAQTCVDCGRTSPDPNEDTTLTSSFGWRIRKTTASDGTSNVEWRCPACWHRFKAGQKASAPSA